MHQETVLVTGGSGYIAGFCIIELLKRGYLVRTTVRNLATQAHTRAAIASFVDPGDRLQFFAADLTCDEGWNEAANGCDYVLHVASPLGIPIPKNPDDLIIPARDGTLRVIRAAIGAGVKRVVMTSSVAATQAAQDAPNQTVSDETTWTDLKDARVGTYERSKTLAERAAFDLIRNSNTTTTLATVNPALVLGPALGNSISDSLQIVQRLLSGKVPGLPNLGFCVVDVRDVADLHIRAMTMPNAAGERFIAAGEFGWMSELATVLRENLGQDAARVPKYKIPDFLLRFYSIFNKDIVTVTPWLSKSRLYSSAKAQQMLDWKIRPMQETVVECGRSLVAAGLV